MKYTPELRALIWAAVRIEFTPGGISGERWIALTPEVVRDITAKIAGSRIADSAIRGESRDWEGEPLTDAEAHALGNALQAAGRVLVELADKARVEAEWAAAGRAAADVEGHARRFTAEDRAAAESAIALDGLPPEFRAAVERVRAPAEKRRRDYEETVTELAKAGTIRPEEVVEYLKANAVGDSPAAATARAALVAWEEHEARRRDAWRRFDEVMAEHRKHKAESGDITRKPDGSDDKGTDE